MNIIQLGTNVFQFIKFKKNQRKKNVKQDRIVRFNMVNKNTLLSKFWKPVRTYDAAMNTQIAVFCSDE